MRGRIIKLMGIGALGVGLLGFAGVAMARGPGGPMGGHALKEVLKALDLDEEQQALAAQLREEHQGDREATREFHDKAKEVFLTEMAKEKPNSRTLHGLIDEGAALATEAAHSGLDGLLELQATFSPEQRQTFVEEMGRLNEEREQRHEEMREHHGQRGPKGDQ